MRPRQSRVKGKILQVSAQVLYSDRALGGRGKPSIQEGEEASQSMIGGGLIRSKVTTVCIRQKRGGRSLFYRISRGRAYRTRHTLHWLRAGCVRDFKRHTNHKISSGQTKQNLTFWLGHDNRRIGRNSGAKRKERKKIFTEES